MLKILSFTICKPKPKTCQSKCGAKLAEQNKSGYCYHCYPKEYEKTEAAKLLQRIRARNYRKKHKDEILARQRKYYARNRDRWIELYRTKTLKGNQ
jgi:hypothetical protein